MTLFGFITGYEPGYEHGYKYDKKSRKGAWTRKGAHHAVGSDDYQKPSRKAAVRSSQCEQAPPDYFPEQDGRFVQEPIQYQPQEVHYSNHAAAQYQQQVAQYQQQAAQYSQNASQLQQQSLITTVASTNKLHEADKLALIRVAARRFIASPNLTKELGITTTLFLKGASVVALPTRTSICHHLHVLNKAPTSLSSTQTIRPRSQPIDPPSQSVGPAVIILSPSMKVENAILFNSRIASPITSPIDNLSAKVRIMVSLIVNPITKVHTMRHERIKEGNLLSTMILPPRYLATLAQLEVEAESRKLSCTGETKR
ncbi:MAG: hypothetical protein Q9192_001370 [Flavoplaca navasiana]